MLSNDDIKSIVDLRDNHGMKWAEIQAMFSHTSDRTIRRKYKEYKDSLESQPKLQEPVPKSPAEEVKQKEAIAPVCEDEEQADYSVLLTSSTITLKKTIQYGLPVISTVTEDHINYDLIKRKLLDSNFSDDVIEECYQLSSVSNAISSFTQGKLTVDVKNNTITYNKTPLKNSAVERILDMIKSGSTQKEINHLVNFLDLLTQNPSNDMYNRLHDFIRAKDVKIDEDGHLLCYKVVTSDYKDKHTRTFDNSVGQTVVMERFLVNHNDEETCSAGLHVCSKSYIRHFSSQHDRVVLCKVSPADFVSIPTDYNDAKARVCKYTVVADVTNEI